jgi:hypothetical protein
MKVKLCSRCPYTPRDLTGHFDSEAALHVCAKCDDEREASTNYDYSRKPHRRQQCVTVSNIPGMAQASVAQSATEGLASYGTTAAERLFVRGSALTVSGLDRKATADGYFDLTPPENACDETPATTFRGSGYRSKEPAQGASHANSSSRSVFASCW